MTIKLSYKAPDFDQQRFVQAPAAKMESAPADGIAPANYHATSNFPEYVKIGSGEWLLAPESRMDAVLVYADDRLEVTEARRLRRGDPVVVGRTENGEEGIFVHDKCFEAQATREDKFSFRTRGTRETPFSHSYDDLYRHSAP